MSSEPEPTLLRQLPVIQKVIQDETWLEAERRGCPVSPQDPAVREHVCQVILRIGRELRETLTIPPSSPITDMVRNGLTRSPSCSGDGGKNE